MLSSQVQIQHSRRIARHARAVRYGLLNLAVGHASWHCGELFADEQFWSGLRNSLKYVLVVPVIQVISILVALLVNRPLRGIGFYDTSLAAKPTVSIYQDQVPIPFSIMTRGATLDLERVEVLKFFSL